MSKQLSSSILLHQLQRLNRRVLEIALRDFGQMSEEQLNWKPRVDQWNILQCLEHSTLFLEHYLPLLEGTLRENKLHTSTPTYKVSQYGKYGIKMVKINRNNQLKVTLHSRKAFQPTEEPQAATDQQAIIIRYEKNVQKLAKLLLQAETLPLGKIKIPFNFWGLFKIKLGDLLQVLVYHTERHLVQAQRVLYDDNFPIDLEALEADLAHRSN